MKYAACPNCGRDNRDWSVYRCSGSHLFCLGCSVSSGGLFGLGASEGCPRCGERAEAIVGEIAPRRVPEASFNVPKDVLGSVASWFSFPSDVEAGIREAGYVFIKKNENSLSCWATIRGVRRQLVVDNGKDYLSFNICTRFQYDSEWDFPRDLLYRALCNAGKSYEYYFTIRRIAVFEKWVLLARQDQWKGAMKAKWIPLITSGLFRMCDSLEEGG
jgi:hypothetical protein